MNKSILDGCVAIPVLDRGAWRLRKESGDPVVIQGRIRSRRSRKRSTATAHEIALRPTFRVAHFDFPRFKLIWSVTPSADPQPNWRVDSQSRDPPLPAPRR